MNEIYKSVADGCVRLQDRLESYSQDKMLIYKEKEEQLKTILSQMPSSDEIEKILSLVGLNMNEFYKLYDEKKIQDAILYAKDLKDRYTVLWLYYDIFGDELAVNKY